MVTEREGGPGVCAWLAWWRLKLAASVAGRAGGHGGHARGALRGVGGGGWGGSVHRGVGSCGAPSVQGQAQREVAREEEAGGDAAAEEEHEVEGDLEKKRDTLFKASCRPE
ncbi:hypothetical protein KFL_005910065 [Klebsormidium nitens]|uniref:Uncharacterized protein n=1 Tax=Klebsormidium nitens TaxID=105231 RepID=A0A1Y1ILL5_KLENI|nr:hypothetical protein KFL_005910065 [Klebsormidium nitens]|eukprot:GAQ90031.1 hypothetical protein KFL_005910065 [Klebsormidium nitens]